MARMHDLALLGWQLSAERAEGLAWAMESLPLAQRSHGWPALLDFLLREGWLLEDRAAQLQRRLAVLQGAAGVTAAEAVALACAQPGVQAEEAAAREAGAALRLWTRLVGVPLETCLEQGSKAIR